jgi:hypothetical protein
VLLLVTVNTQSSSCMQQLPMTAQQNRFVPKLGMSCCLAQILTHHAGLQLWFKTVAVHLKHNSLSAQVCSVNFPQLPVSGRTPFRNQKHMPRQPLPEVACSNAARPLPATAAVACHYSASCCCSSSHHHSFSQSAHRRICCLQISKCLQPVI